MIDLKQLRKDQRLTQRQVAAAAGLKPGSYCDIENGKKGTKPSTAKKIAAVLGFSWTEFYEEVKSDRGKVSGAAEETAERMAPTVKTANTCGYDAPGV